MKTVLDVLNRVGATSSKKEKEAILKVALSSNALLRRVAQYALNQGQSFNLTGLPEVGTNGTPENIDGIFACLDALKAKRGATHEEARQLAMYCNNAAAHDVVVRILRKDLDIGAGAETFNKAMPDLIYIVPYNRYSSFSQIDPDALRDVPMLVQLKNDGFFSYMQDPLLAKGNPFCTRQGNTFSLHGAVEKDFAFLRKLQAKVGEPIRIEGELLVRTADWSGFLPRSKGNGLLAEFYNGDGTAMPGFAERIRYIIWGYVTESEYQARESCVVYRDVWRNLQSCFAENAGKRMGVISLTDSKPVASFEEAMAFYRKMRERGLEGAMLKILDKLVWKHNSSGNLNGFKMKAEAEAEFEIVDAYPGKPNGKWKNHLGGLTVKSSCGQILTNIGGGFSDDERMLGLDWWKAKKGKIITGKFTGIVKDKTGRTTYCLEHSRMPHLGAAFVETRFSEKEEADDLAYCQKQLDNA